MKTTIIKYGNSTTGYSSATLRIGSRGGVTCVEHDGDRRVTKAALCSCLRDHLAGDKYPSLVTTAGDCLPVRFASSPR